MFHFTRRRIEAHVCICFVALKVYKELERLLKLSDIKMSVDKVLNMTKTVTTISVYMPHNKTHFIKTMPMKRHSLSQNYLKRNFGRRNDEVSKHAAKIRKKSVHHPNHSKI